MISSTLVAGANDGSVTLEGRGSSSSSPEFVSLGIVVTSICYDSSTEAAAANSEMANRILDVFQNFKRTDKDRITATGGANSLQTETTQIGAESKVLCEMKWHAENYLKIEMSNIDELPKLQDQVLAAIEGPGTIDPAHATQTFSEFGKPEFHLYPETAKKMRESAQVSAFDDAKSQLNALSTRCEFTNLRLIRLSPAEYSYIYKLAGERMPVLTSSTPVIPDELEVTATLRMEWAFDPGSAACRFQ
jgi:uncharacterized protein YggE